MIKRILQGAAVLIIGGAAIGTAIYSSMITEGENCASFCAALAAQGQKDTWHFAYIAVQDGFTVPKAYSDRVIGDCSGGTCAIPIDNCDCNLEYEYTAGPLEVGWRVVELFGPLYWLGGFNVLADGEAGVRWFSSLKDAVTECLVYYTPTQCVTLFDADKKCWELNDGTICRYGLDPTGAACAYAQVKRPFPCLVYGGETTKPYEMADKVFTAEELNSP